jgi:hypothetical protein
MTVKIPVSLTQEEETKLQAQAKAEGISVDVLLRRAILQVISSSPDSGQISAEHWEREFEEWLDGLPTLATLSDEAISRESIYTREDEWR